MDLMKGDKTCSRLRRGFRTCDGDFEGLVCHERVPLSRADLDAGRRSHLSLVMLGVETSGRVRRRTIEAWFGCPMS